ncbi:MAG: methyltransferase domain-containing protein [Candidatus Falkowbacteria bacterium]
MNAQEFNYLKSEAGQAAYQRYRFYDLKKLELLILKNNATQPEFGALVSLIKLRQAAAGKFSRSESMFFTPLSLEQATSEIIAKHIAARFQPAWKVADLTCGLGGNAIFLAQKVKHVLAIDLDETKINCAKENAAAYEVQDKIDFVVGDAFLNIKEDVAAFFLDPARDREGATKTRSFLNSQPALLDILPKLFAITHNVAVKISPAFDYEELKLLPEEPELEIISENNNCKVAMLWFGAFKTAQRRATGFKGEKFFSMTGGAEKNIDITPLKKYLYEPNKAISKAHLINEVAAKFSLAKINFDLSWLTSDELVDTDGLNIFRKFKVLHSEDFSLKKFKEFLKNRGIGRAEIMTKHFPMTPEEIRARLKLKDGGTAVLILTVDNNDKKVFILAEKVD